MIPLCPTHHAQASAFSQQQLRELKTAAQERGPATGRFEWLRRDIVGAVGGCLYHETPILVQLRNEPMVWFERDEVGHALLNVRMLTTTGKEEERIRIENNDFIVRGTPTEFECPTSGRILRARYENGDYMRVEFREIRSEKTACDLFRHLNPSSFASLHLQWPMTFVIVTMAAGGTHVRFGPNMTRLPGNNRIYGAVMSHCGTGLVFG